MGTHAATRSRRSRLGCILISARFRALLSLGMVLGLGVVGTMAAWSTSATAGSGEFSTGTVDINLNGNEGLTAVNAYNFTTGSVLPGKSVAQVIAVRNTGSLALNYGVTVYGSGTLLPWLTVTAQAGGSVSDGICVGGTGQASVSSVPTNPLTPATLSTAAGQVGSATGTANYCVQASLSLLTPATFQAATAELVLLFTGTGVSSA
ncbi:hypothetical protein E4P29_02550 [Rhodococcus sp. 1R11]|uniref:SipW-dependent-type signal peptide-containing protein n=1 Tax=Rhodococcus sp. 1R11 TaxID=2559614 RepID=UPI001072BA95|nr:SipW-dependent-type signal peptide-containing protein [Rhodococcus sp. 1R11]TFI45842.1 hypothetical protein E4P29_02550 [Rhodococcus sp. 1R11]